MWWEGLNFLDAVERTGSMTKAARALGVDKATVSRRMQELRDTAPAPVFEPSERGIRLTSYGARAVAAFRAHERARQTLMAELTPNERDARASVRVTMPSFFACDVVVPAIEKLARRHPEIALQLDASNQIVDMTAGNTDLAIRNLVPREPTLVVQKLGRLGLAMYASHKYLARRGGLERTHDLGGHDLIVYDSGPYAGPGFEWLPEAARVGRVAFCANDAYTLRDAARAGLGMAVLPHCVGDSAPELRRVEGAGQGITDILLVMRGTERRIARIRRVATFLAELVRGQQPRLYAPHRD